MPDSRISAAVRCAATMALLAMTAVAAPVGAQGAGVAPTYSVSAVRYATLPQFPVRSLIAGADPARRLDIAMMVWVVRGGGRTILVDAGFYRQKFIDQRRPTDFLEPSEAVSTAMGIRPEDVTDIVVSHIHWDHADGVDLFPNARVWIQREEYEHHVGPEGQRLDNAVDTEDAPVFARLKAAGKVNLIDGDAKEIFPGVTVYTGGKHTFQSQYVGVQTAQGTVVIASDNLYLYENLDTRKPISQTLDAASNLAAQERMLTIASDRRLIVPGHDPAVFERFRTSGRVATIVP
jgi:glyoxylase-like metal-dependent hydrolase (beta-lactamase superfamily II)